MTERTVFAVDLTSAHVSIARVSSTDDLPRVKRIAVDNLGEHSTATTVQRINAAASATLAAVTKNGDPELVVMAKFWTSSGMDREPAQARRAWLWFAIVERLVERGIPVAELPMLTIQAWAGTMVDLRKGAIELLESDVRRRYPDIKEPLHYRLTTVAFACAGAMAVGIDTEYAVTTERLVKLAGRGRNAVQWPHELTPPATLKEWSQRVRSVVDTNT